jgi:hypothetical protein
MNPKSWRRRVESLSSSQTDSIYNFNVVVDILEAALELQLEK